MKNVFIEFLKFLLREVLGWCGFSMVFYGMYIVHPAIAFILCGAFLYWLTVKGDKK
jgi:hypothetical protein